MKYWLINESEIQQVIDYLLYAVSDPNDPQYESAKAGDHEEPIAKMLRGVKARHAPTGPRRPIGRIGEVDPDDRVFAWHAVGGTAYVPAGLLKDNPGFGYTHFCEIYPVPPESPAKAPSKPGDTGSASKDLSGSATWGCADCARKPTCRLVSSWDVDGWRCKSKE
jgi:hypothetical protein